MERLHNRDIKIHKCEMTPEIFARLHASRLIGFLLKLDFNHVRREKCKGLEGKNCLLRLKSWSWSLYWRACIFFFELIWSPANLQYSNAGHRDNSRWLYNDPRIQFTQFPSLDHKPFVDGRRVAKKPHFSPVSLLWTSFRLISIRMAKNEFCKKKRHIFRLVAIVEGLNLRVNRCLVFLNPFNFLY